MRKEEPLSSLSQSKYFIKKLAVIRTFK